MSPRPPLKRISYRPQPWVEETAYVWLRPTDHGADEWEVYADEEGNGHLGRISKYQGTLDRPISRGSRIVHRGKTRTLWSYREPPSEYERYPRASWDNYSRADCIRALVRWRQLREGRA